MACYVNIPHSVSSNPQMAHISAKKNDSLVYTIRIQIQKALGVVRIIKAEIAYYSMKKLTKQKLIFV